MLSIITVCFNSIDTIEKTFDSVLNQSLLPYEYIVVDGCSQDGTVDMIKGYSCKFIEKGVTFKWISEKDSGIYDAMNKGISLSTGNWLHFLNSDDYYVNRYVLENVFDYLQKSTAMILYGQTISIGVNRQYVISPIPVHRLKLNMLIGCPIQQPSSFYSRSLFIEGQYTFDTTYKISADYKMFIQMLQDNVRFQYIPVFITFFYEGGISTIHRDDLTFREDMRLLKETHTFTLFMMMKRNKYLCKFLIILFQFLSKF